jgi:hypothetical protein
MHITTVFKRIEALEETVTRKCARGALERLRCRALDSLTNDQLVALVGCLRWMCGDGAQPGESEWGGWQAYQTALEREQAASGWPPVHRNPGISSAWPPANQRIEGKYA